MDVLCPQIWRSVSRRAASHPGRQPQRHPACFPPAGTNAQHHSGTRFCVADGSVKSDKSVYYNACFLLQDYYSGRALREIGPFLRYMESEFNIKVRVGFVPQIAQKVVVVAGLTPFTGLAFI